MMPKSCGGCLALVVAAGVALHLLIALVNALVTNDPAAPGGLLQSSRRLRENVGLLLHRPERQQGPPSQEAPAPHRSEGPPPLQSWERVAPFQPHLPRYSFVLIAAHRIGAQSFAVVGLGALSSHQFTTLGGCSWAPAGGGEELNGTLSIAYFGEHHELAYEAFVLHCTFAPPGVGPEAHIPGPQGQYLVPRGGALAVGLNEEAVPVYEESAPGGGGDPGAGLEPEAPFRFDVAHCSPPLYGNVDAPRVREWLAYHRALGVQYFVLYDVGGVGAEVMAVLQPYVDAGAMEVVRATEAMKYGTWLYSQVGIINDCALRVRYLAKWAVFLDFDEYLTLNSSAPTLGAFLDQYEGKPYVTFGSVWYSIYICNAGRENDTRWPVERMPFHWPDVYCVYKEKFPEKMCLDYWGHRKYAVDPRRVALLHIHAVEAAGGAAEGVDLSTDAARVNHYRGLVARGGDKCNQTRANDGDKIDWWVHSGEVAALSGRARQLAAAGEPLALRPATAS